jgi:hypothetical protein
MFVTTLVFTSLLAGIVLWLASQLLIVQTEASEALIEHWSRTQGLRVVRAERCWLATGPFPMTGALDAPTFHVVTRTSHGVERTAWVRCGSFPLGVILDPVVEARWN